MLWRLTALSLFLTFAGSPVFAQDAGLCLFTAERILNGEKLKDQEKQAAHEACQRALSDTASVVQKYQLQEADFEITGTRPRN